MANMQQFTDNILARKTEGFQQELAVLQEKLNEEQMLFLQKLSEQETTQQETLASEINAREIQARQSVDNDYRNALLRAKQEKFSALFDKAHDAMANWDQSRMQKFAQSVFQQLDTTKQYTCTFGGLTPFVTIETPSYVTVNESVISNEAGFVLESNGVVYNYLFSTLLSTLKHDFMGELAVIVAQ